MAPANDPNTGASNGSATPAPNPAPTDGLRLLPLFLYCFPIDHVIEPFDYTYDEHTRTDSLHDDPNDLTSISQSGSWELVMFGPTLCSQTNMISGKPGSTEK
jgi:hypothetical protein